MSSHPETWGHGTPRKVPASKAPGVHLPHGHGSFGPEPGWPCPRHPQATLPQATCFYKGKERGRGNPTSFPGLCVAATWAGTRVPRPSCPSWPGLGATRTTRAGCPTCALAVRSSRCWQVMGPRASLWSLSQGSWIPGPSCRGGVGAAKDKVLREETTTAVGRVPRRAHPLPPSVHQPHPCVRLGEPWDRTGRQHMPPARPLLSLHLPPSYALK